MEYDTWKYDFPVRFPFQQKESVSKDFLLNRHTIDEAPVAYTFFNGGCSRFLVTEQVLDKYLQLKTKDLLAGVPLFDNEFVYGSCRFALEFDLTSGVDPGPRAEEDVFFMNDILQCIKTLEKHVKTSSRVHVLSRVATIHPETGFVKRGAHVVFEDIHLSHEDGKLLSAILKEKVPTVDPVYPANDTSARLRPIGSRKISDGIASGCYMYRYSMHYPCKKKDRYINKDFSHTTSEGLFKLLKATCLKTFIPLTPLANVPKQTLKRPAAPKTFTATITKKQKTEESKTEIVLDPEMVRKITEQHKLKKTTKGKRYSDGTIVLQTKNKKCPISNRTHHSNTIYYVIKPTGIITVRCHDEACKGKKSRLK